MINEEGILNHEGVLVCAGAIRQQSLSREREDSPKATDYIAAARKTLKAGQPVVNPTTQPWAGAANFLKRRPVRTDPIRR